MARIPERVEWAVDLVNARPAEHLLEIGCGGGHAVALICARLTTGTITAIDRSTSAVAHARSRNAGCIATGRARIEKQTLTHADLGRRFAKVFAINVNAFWTDGPRSFAALSGLLQRNGVAYLIYEPPATSRLREVQSRLTAELGETGFENVDVHVKALGASHGLCIVSRLRRK
jgi:trans-aconitate methyltransferase